MPHRKVRKLFSTGQIAELIGTNAKSVANWIDRGYLKGIHFPGTGERRVSRDELRRFLEQMEYIWAIRELDMEEGKLPPQEPPAAPPPAGPKRPKTPPRKGKKKG